MADPKADAARRIIETKRTGAAPQSPSQPSSGPTQGDTQGADGDSDPDSIDVEELSRDPADHEIVPDIEDEDLDDLEDADADDDDTVWDLDDEEPKAQPARASDDNGGN